MRFAAFLGCRRYLASLPSLSGVVALDNFSNCFL